MRVSLQVSREGAEPPMLGVAVERESLASNLYVCVCMQCTRTVMYAHVHMYMNGDSCVCNMLHLTCIPPLLPTHSHSHTLTHTHAPVLSCVLLHHPKVRDLHGPLPAGHPQVVLRSPAGIAYHIGDQQLDLRLLPHVQQDTNHLDRQTDRQTDRHADV